MEIHYSILLLVAKWSKKNDTHFNTLYISPEYWIYVLEGPF